MQLNAVFREGIAEEKPLGEFLSDPDCWLFAAMEGRNILGFAYGYRLRRLHGEGAMLYIHEVGVVPSERHRGIGTRLMEELKAACRKDGIEKIFLTTYRSNDAANGLYRKTGGEVSPESNGEDTVYWFSTKE